MVHGFTSILFAASSLLSPVVAFSRVSTTSGILNGFIDKDVATFLGIPYALPPVGDLRWRHALPVNAPGAEVNATKFGPGCGQLLTSGVPSILADIPTILPTEESEDCLSLNIWAPRGRKQLPVIVFIAGGGYLIGTSSSTLYYGHHFARTDRAILVSVNYRHNIWGFPSTTPIDGIDQNVGITDVRLAVEWVVKNIAQFGGDPSRVILAGESAGAHLVDAYVYAYEKNPIVIGQISASGAIGQFSSAPADGAFWNNISDILGCGITINPSQITCMRNATFNAVKSTALKLDAYFTPTADNFIIFTNDTYFARAANGSFAHIPALLSNVNNEGTIFLEPYSSSFPSGTTADVASDNMICPIARAAASKRQAGVPTWRAWYLAVWDNLALLPSNSDIGAYHGSDIPIIFGTFADPTAWNGSATEEERQLSARYMDAWLTFAENPEEGLSMRLQWPVYDPNPENSRTLVEIGKNNSSSVIFGSSTQYDLTCP